MGTQGVPATVTADQAGALNAMNQENLGILLNNISTDSTSSVQYLHVSYDIVGNTVSNFYFGCVTRIDYVPNNGQDIINAINKNGAWLLNNPIILQYNAYIVGTPPMGTFHYIQDIETATEKWIAEEDLRALYPDDATALAELQNKFLSQIQTATNQAYQQNGINVTVISAEILTATLDKRMMWLAGKPLGRYEYALTIKYRLTLDSDRAFQNSPIVPIVLAAIVLIAKIVAVAVVASITAYLIVEWLKSMTTKTWTSTQTTYGWVKNPNTGQYEWLPTGTKTESGTAPDVGGILSTGTIIGAVALVGLVILIVAFKGTGKGA